MSECQYCGQQVAHGKFHGDHSECLDALWSVVMFAGSKDEAIVALQAYGDWRAGQRAKASEDVAGAPD